MLSLFQAGPFAWHMSPLMRSRRLINDKIVNATLVMSRNKPKKAFTIYDVFFIDGVRLL